MIKIDNEIINIGNFPDGAMLVKYEPTVDQHFHHDASIIWKYENDREFLCLMYLVKHLRAIGVDKIYLNMPYVPNARQDRVKTSEDVFTLKYFADLLNSLNLTEICVLDPHSSVTEALIDNLLVDTPEDYIRHAIDNLMTDTGDDFLMFYPDEGAMKRYSGMVNAPYTFGIKKRNWETGKIEGLDVAGAVERVADKNILIIDDICSRGGTFYHRAKKLKELGAKKIYLYVTHCENTILEGELLTSGLIEKVYTTNSIFTKEHEMIEVFEL